MAEFEVKEKVQLFPASKDKEETTLAQELGYFIELNQNKNVLLRFVNGGYKSREYLDLVIWQKLVESRRRIIQVESENDTKGRASLKRERKRVEDLLKRASKEMSLHEPTLMLALEISNNPDAEKVLFGGKSC